MGGKRGILETEPRDHRPYGEDMDEVTRRARKKSLREPMAQALDGGVSPAIRGIGRRGFLTTGTDAGSAKQDAPRHCE